jgi:YbbR domain-containing protein
MKRFWDERQLYLVLSLAVAVIMWLYVTTGQNPVISRSIRLDLQLRNLPANEILLRPSAKSPGQVTVRLQGPRSQIAQLVPGLIEAYVDLSGLGPGEHPQVPVTVVPGVDVRVIDQKPATILVLLDQVTTKRMPVEVSLMGTPPGGITLETPRIAPTQVTVSGPSRQVNQVRHAVLYYDASSVHQEVVASLSVSPVDANAQPVPGVQVTPQTVNMTLAVRESVISKVVPVVPTVIGTPPQTLTLLGATADPASVTLTGPSMEVQALENAPTVPLDISGARANFSRRLALQLPAGMRASASQVTVNVRVGRAQLSTVFKAVPVRVVGVPAGTASRVVPDKVDVQVEGPQDVVRRLSAQAVTVEVSAAGKRRGQYTTSPRAIVPPGVHILGIQPSQVMIILSSS